MEKALGEENEAGKETVIQKIVDRSIAQCPVLNITQCQREALGRDGERCSDACASTSTYEIAQCLGVDYPFDVYHNRNSKGRPYEERACCNVGESREMGLSDDEIQDAVCVETDGFSRGVLIGIILGSIAACSCLGLLFARIFCGLGKRGGRRRENSKMNNTGRVEHHSSTVPAEMATGNIQAIPVPSAPPQPV